MASYPERVTVNFDILHKDVKILNRATVFENPQILHKLAY